MCATCGSASRAARITLKAETMRASGAVTKVGRKVVTPTRNMAAQSAATVAISSVRPLRSCPAKPFTCKSTKPAQSHSRTPCASKFTDFTLPCSITTTISRPVAGSRPQTRCECSANKGISGGRAPTPQRHRHRSCNRGAAAQWKQDREASLGPQPCPLPRRPYAYRAPKG